MDYLAKFSGQEFDEYSAMVSKGIIYDVVADVRNKVGKDIERDEAKIAMFCMLFSSNRGGSSSPYYWFRKYFAEIFPSVSEIFKIIKHDFKIFEGIDGKQHGRLACLLQSIESEIVLHRICKRI